MSTATRDRGSASEVLERRAARHRVLGDVHRLAIVDALRHSDRRPAELGRATGLGSNLLAFHLGKLEQAGVVERTVSAGDARRRYVRLCGDATADAGPTWRPPLGRALFVCSRNASRSRLAAALWVARTGLAAGSVGHEPAAAIDPLTVAVARDHGLDLGDARPRGYDTLTTRPDLLVSVCDRAGEATLPYPHVPRLHWSVPDPVGGSRGDVEAVLRELASRIDHLLADAARAS